MKNLFFIIILFMSLFQLILSSQKRYQYDPTEFDDFFKFFKKKNLNQNNDDSSSKIEKAKAEVDPNDRVHIDLWNKLNNAEIKDMPTITDYSSELQAVTWLKWYLRIAERYYQINAELGFQYATNMTVENQKAMNDQGVFQQPFSRNTFPIAKKFNKYMKNSKNDDIRRIFRRLSSGTISLDSKNTAKSSSLLIEMENIYATTEVCELNDTNKCYTLTPYLDQTMFFEKDYDRLVWAWKGWHDGCGNKIRPLYVPFVDSINKNAKQNGYKDVSELWVEEYEMGNATVFDATIKQLLKDIMPLYTELHAYVRGRLCALYPKRFACDGPIPAHLLGNMWAQNWQNRLDDVYPFPDTPLVTMADELENKGYSIEKMYTTAEDFFTSIGLYPMTPKFWARSMFKKPVGRDVDCQASASDLKYRDDYRVKICTQLDEDNFYTLHHEMGHVEYYMSYDNAQPYVYQDGANSGFHEAIGDTIGMYAISPKHSIRLGFLKKEDADLRYQLNFLMRLALQKVAFIPFSFVMDKYRFLLFRNEIDPVNELNSMWWALRVEHGGIMAAVPRNENVNFDPGAKYHIDANVPYFRYFIAHFLEFQFYRALCRLQGQTAQLHMCDIYGNKEVGERFKQMLAMGNSKPWEEVLYSLTGESKLESQALLDFFKPLYEWLKEENAKQRYPVGWE